MCDALRCDVRVYDITLCYSLRCQRMNGVGMRGRGSAVRVPLDSTSAGLLEYIDTWRFAALHLIGSRNGTARDAGYSTAAPSCRAETVSRAERHDAERSSRGARLV